MPRTTKHAREAKENEALRLRLAGGTYDAIARVMGYANRDGAWKAVDRALARQRAEAADQLLALELTRLDALQRGVFATALGGNVQAIASVLKVMDHRAKLTGLYDVQPQGNDHEIRAAFAGFLATVTDTVEGERAAAAAAAEGDAA